MYTLCWSAKGGSGTTVVAAALALLSARSRPTLLVDLGGDLPAALGLAEPRGPGVGDWLASPHATPDRLAALAVEVTGDLQLVPAGALGHAGQAAGAGALDEVQAERLAHACSEAAVDVVVDAGPHGRHRVLHGCADRSLLVVRPCYLALRRALQSAASPTGFVLVHDPARSYTAADVHRIVGAPLMAEVPWDPAVARSVDAGCLVTRMPPAIARPLARLATTAAAA